MLGEKRERNAITNRLYTLDYLRGLAAFGIMIYHFLTWTYGTFSANTFMGRLGIYGVAIFYVLSGLTLYHVYYERMKPTKKDILEFVKKRVFRIFPLLWLVTVVAIIVSWEIPDLTNLFLNLSGLFGFVRWYKYYSAGMWSIGNELVFYFFFPFFILFIKKFKSLMVLVTIVLFGLYLYFAFFKLTTNMSLSEQWKNYINPLNQVFLFLGGFLIGVFTCKIKIKNYVITALLLLSFILFSLFPAEGDTINLVTGTTRLVFTACCFGICICFYKLTFKFPKLIHNPLTLLGEASYSVYLLHPIIYNLIGIFLTISNIDLFHVSESLRLVISVVSTLLISYYVYYYFEKYFIKLGSIKKNNFV